jgi:uncharacterized protein (TIGR02996 family)
VHRNLEIEAAILADPDAPHSYAVYADWLAERDDPHGELIAVQLALEQTPTDPALLARDAELHREHDVTWLNHLTVWPMRPVAVEWRRGFVHTAAIQTSYESNESAMTYRALAELPIARFARELRLGVACSYNGRGDADISIIEALRDAPLPVVRKLALDCFDFELSWTHVGDLSLASAALRPLEALEVTAGSVTLGAIDLPNLRSLRIETGGLGADVLHSIAAAAWPNLESLVLYLGTPDYGGSCTPADVVALLDGANLPRLTTLALCNGTFGDELAELVTRAPILPRLRHLDLSKGTMGTDGARAIAKHARAFAHLSLDLSNNYLTKEDCAAVAHVATSVDAHDQKTEEGYGRFVTVSE